jgi:hypothetical protein
VLGLPVPGGLGHDPEDFFCRSTVCAIADHSHLPEILVRTQLTQAEDEVKSIVKNLSDAQALARSDSPRSDKDERKLPQVRSV